MRRKSPEWEQNGHTRPLVHQSGGLIEKRGREEARERGGEVVGIMATCHLADNSVPLFRCK